MRVPCYRCALILVISMMISVAGFYKPGSSYNCLLVSTVYAGSSLNNTVGMNKEAKNANTYA